jgi:hypothetical protein
MATNPILAKRPDRSITVAVRKALVDGKLNRWDMIDILVAALDGGKVTDVEYRDLKRLMRVQTGLGYLNGKIEDFLEEHYPLEPLGRFPGNVDLLEGGRKKGNHACAALVQSSQPAGQASTWREGIQVRGNVIAKGTPVATFEDGFYPNRLHDNHVAYYLSQNNKGVQVMDQWSSKPSISSRTMAWLGKRHNGLFVDPSNNGDALSVIMRKKRRP